MSVILIILSWLLSSGAVSESSSLGSNDSSKPDAVTVGAIFTLNSTIGKVAKIAIEEAVKDVNADSSVLNGTKLVVNIRNSNCSGFVGLVEALRFMETDAIAIIGPQSSVVAHTVLHVANELQTPFLSFAATDPTLSSLQFPYFIRTTQSDLYQMIAVAEIVSHYGWKEVIAIFIDDDYGRNGLSALDDALAVKRCRVSYKAGIPPGGDISRSDIMDILVRITMMESRVFVVHAYPDVGSMVFSVAHYLGMMDDGYVWIATDGLSTMLDSASHLRPDMTMDTMQGVLVFRQYTPESEKKRLFSVRWSKLTGGELGLSTYALYAYDTVWLLAHAIDSFLKQGGVISFSNDSKLNSQETSGLHLEAMSIFDGGPLLKQNILQSDFIGMTGPVKFTSDKSIVFPAYEIINIIGTGLHRVGYWSNYSGLSTVAPTNLYSQAPNSSNGNQQLYSVVWPGEIVKTPRGWVFPNNGKQLRIGVPIRVSFREFVSQVPGTNTFKGFCIDVFTAAVNLLPYAVPYQFVPFGNGHENPSYSDLVNLITAGVLDGAVGDIAIVTNRTKIVDFTQPYAASGLVVVAPVRKLNTSAWAFLRPFSFQMWGVTVLFFIFIGVVVWILEHRTNDDFRGPPKQQLITMLWFSFSTLFFSHKETTVSTLGRAIVIIWLFVVLIINSSYTASLTSILTVQQLYSPIKGIESLKQSHETIGYQVGSFAQQYLIDGIGIAPERLKELGSPEEYAAALQQGPKNGGVSAIVDERPYVDLFLSSQCKFRVIGQEFTKSGWGFESLSRLFPRDSPLSIDLSTAILTLSENGELQRIRDKWLTKNKCSSDNKELDSDRLYLKSFSGLYILCGLSCFIALLIHLFQMLNRFRNAAPSLTPHGPGSSRLRTFLSIIDEKSDPSKRDSKRRKVENLAASSETSLEVDLESDSKRTQTGNGAMKM